MRKNTTPRHGWWCRMLVKLALASSKTFYYGGQAVIEGVMMRGRTTIAMAGRRPDGTLYLYEEPLNPRIYQNPIFRLPFLRGMLMLWQTLVLGSRMMTLSATIAAGEADAPSLVGGTIATGEAEGGVSLAVRDEQKTDKPPTDNARLILSLLLSMSMAVVVFFVGPVLLANLFTRLLGRTAGESDHSLINVTTEGLLRLGLLIGYLSAIGRVPDVERVFGYHGAEHKAINAMEQGEPLDVEHVRLASRVHTRCGTGFLLLVMVVSIFIFALVPNSSLFTRIMARIALLPVVAGIAYELMRAGAANYRYRVVRWLLTPGLALQGLTTREPDDSMIECAIAALQRVMLRDK